MEILEANAQTVVASLTRRELAILKNALNEVCNGPDAIDAWEFHARVGAERDEAKALLADMRSPLESFRISGDA